MRIVSEKIFVIIGIIILVIILWKCGNFSDDNGYQYVNNDQKQNQIRNRNVNSDNDRIEILITVEPMKKMEWWQNDKIRYRIFSDDRGDALIMVKRGERVFYQTQTQDGRWTSVKVIENTR